MRGSAYWDKPEYIGHADAGDGKMSGAILGLEIGSFSGPLR